MPRCLHLALLLLLSLGPGHLAADIVAGKLTRVLDGDTIDVLEGESTLHRVRLSGIDAPESGQPFGTRAKQALLALAVGKPVEVDWHKRDRYGRLVGKLFAGRDDINLALVRAGYAWWYRDYAREQSESDRRVYEQAETQARDARAGLWRDPSPQPPWEFRHGPVAADCPCDSARTCIGRRGGVYCVRASGSKKYLPRGHESEGQP